MKNTFIWRKQILLPAATIAVLFVAGSAVTRATFGSPTSPGSAVSATTVPGVRPPPESAAELEAFCDQNWGELSPDGAVCRFTQLFHVNLTQVGGGVALTHIPLVPFDTLSLEASNPPEVVVGGKIYGASGETVLLTSAGVLSFRAAQGQAFFSVQRVSLERCYSKSGGVVSTVTCPAH